MASSREDAEPAPLWAPEGELASASVVLFGHTGSRPGRSDLDDSADELPTGLPAGAGEPLSGLLGSADLVVENLEAVIDGAHRAASPLRLRPQLTGGVRREVSIVAGTLTAARDGGPAAPRTRAAAPGCGPLSASDLADRIRALRREHPGELIIAVPHHRHESRWACAAQRTAARELTRAGADVVIGHGSPLAQEIDIVAGRPILHGIGDALSAAPAGSSPQDGPPLSAAVGLHLSAEKTQLRIHPLPVGEPASSAGPTVTAERFEEFYLTALGGTHSSAAFLRAVGTGQDAHGPFLEIPLTSSRRARVNPHRRGLGSTLTYWEQEPVEISFDRRSPNSRFVLERELHRQRATVVHLDAATVTGRSSSGTPYLMRASVTHHTGVPGTRAVKRKDLTRRILQEAGASVAPGAHFADATELEQAAELMREIGPVVVKPVDGNIGRGVTVGVDTDEQLRAAWSHAFSETRTGVLVEQQFSGEEFRISVVDGLACAATRRVPPQITGDGVRSVRELINDRNDERHRHLVLHSKPLDLAGHRLRRLLDAGLTPLSVLPAGETHVIDRMGSVGSGAHPVHCIEEIDPSYLREAERAARAFPDLDIVGVDMLCAETSAPASADNHIIIEVNSKPEVATHAAAPSPRAPRSFPALVVASALAAPTIGPFRRRRRRPRRPASPTSAGLLAAEFAARGMDIVWWDDHYFHARAGGATVSVWGSATDRTGGSARWATRNAELSRALLHGAHLPLPPEEGHERPATGEEIRFLVAHGRVLAALDAADPDRTGVLRTLHPSHRAVAAAAAGAFPGLDLAEVRLHVEEPRRPAVREQTLVLGVRAEPDLADFAARAGRGRDLLRTVVDLHLGGTRPVPEPEVTWTAPVTPRGPGRSGRSSRSRRRSRR